MMTGFGKILALTTIVALFSCKTTAPDTKLSEAGAGQSTADHDADIAQITNLVAEYRAASTEGQRTSVRTALFNLLTTRGREGQLSSLLQSLVGSLPAFSESNREKIKAAAAVLHNSIRVELSNRSSFDSWEAVDTKLMAKVNQTKGMPLFGALEKLAGSDFLPVKGGKLLINGEASWELRRQLIETSSKSIWIFCWSFYNDLTGNDGIDTLIARKKKNPEMDIRIVVDGAVQSKEGSNKITQKILDAGIGIEFINWSHPRLLGFGMHRKIMIFDHGNSNEAAIFGGMNYGDNYSHENKTLPPIEQWRDTDMVVYGPVVRQAARQFADAWNNFIDTPGTLVTTPGIKKMAAPAIPKKSGKSDWMLAFIDQDPALLEKNSAYIDPVYAATLKMIDSAKESVEISNAYFMSSLPIERALLRASNRGVQVRVHTNSDGSLCNEDKPLLGPIYSSLGKLLNGYASDQKSAAYKTPQVYLQKKHTMHSKYLVVDKLYGWVGSYNIHPRSYRYESENVGMFYGKAVGGEVHQMFATDAGNSDLATPAELVIEQHPLFGLLQEFFFDQI